MFSKIRVENPNFGLLLRSCLFLVVMLAGLALAQFVNWVFALQVPTQWVLASFLLVAVPVGASVIFAELPRGDDWVLARLGMATFCRTGMSLLVVLIVGLKSDTGFLEGSIGFLSFFYIVGIFTSVVISVSRFGMSKSQGEVDRAVV